MDAGAQRAPPRTEGLLPLGSIARRRPRQNDHRPPGQILPVRGSPTLHWLPHETTPLAEMLLSPH